MAFEAKIIADSISEAGKRITTMQLKYWRAIHSEMMTHRVFSRNASSSRAIPVTKMIEQVRYDPAMPIHWGKNQPGMQAKEELTGRARTRAIGRWLLAAEAAANNAEVMAEIGAHKQVVNRILEPFQWIHVVVTATEWDNFFELRAHEDAQPEIHHLALLMKAAMDASTPKMLSHGHWHLPYVTDEDKHTAIQRSFHDLEDVVDVLSRVSVARCCRVSYLKHDGHPSTIEEDLALCDRLAGARPLHASPFEHIATPDVLQAMPRGKMAQWYQPKLHGNFTGWIQFRKLIESQFS